MLLRKLVVVGLVGFASLAASIAIAEEAGAPQEPFVGLENANLVDPAEIFGSDRFRFRVSSAEQQRFAGMGLSSPSESSTERDYRRVELALVARATNSIGVTIAQRGGLGFNTQGDIASETRGSELRLGRVTGTRRPSSAPTWYVFAAAEDEALTWQPGGARSEFGGRGASFAVQDRVEIGDRQAGITYARNGWEASLAHVQREISTSSGAQTISRDEDFTGFTFTMRR